MTTQALLMSLLQYKASANDELLDALAKAEPEMPHFATALRVLNHAHMVDDIFAANLQKLHHAYTASWAPQAPSLARLAADIRNTDRWYLDYVSTIATEALGEVIDFTFTDGSQGRMSREEMLAHVITHAGYHRGEVGRLLPEIEATSSRDVFAGYLHRSEPGRRN